MNHRVLYIGIDNGISGSIATISGARRSTFCPVPTKSEQDYTKARKNTTRIDHRSLYRLLKRFVDSVNIECRVVVLLERPMINPGRFTATTSAVRAWESTLIALERLHPMPIKIVVDSKEWQKVMLPQRTSKKELKKMSRQVGCRLFPSLADVVTKHKDADSLLMAEWARRNEL
jgi:hypothetical protein